MSRRLQLLCAWSALPMIVLLFTGIIVAGFIIPPAPGASAREIAHTYATHADRIRLGVSVFLLSIALMFPFGAAVATQTRRIAGARVLTYCQIAALGSASVIFIIPPCMWMTAAFRPERLASEIQLLNDLGWITFILAFVAFTAWNVSIALAILSDEREQPVYPRWVGYLSAFVAVVFLPDILIGFFHTGPFDWRGIFPFYIPAAAYAVWVLATMVMTVKAIEHEDESAHDGVTRLTVATHA